MKIPTPFISETPSKLEKRSKLLTYQIHNTPSVIVLIGEIDLSKAPMIQVALAILAGKNHLLVVEKVKSQLDLPGNQTVPSERAVNTLVQLLTTLGLAQTPRGILYLQQYDESSTKRKIIGMVGLVHLKRLRRIDVPLSRFEPVEKLRSTKHVSLLLKAVLEWIFS